MRETMLTCDIYPKFANIDFALLSSLKTTTRRHERDGASSGRNAEMTMRPHQDDATERHEGCHEADGCRS